MPFYLLQLFAKLVYFSTDYQCGAHVLRCEDLHFTERRTGRVPQLHRCTKYFFRPLDGEGKIKRALAMSVLGQPFAVGFVWSV